MYNGLISGIQLVPDPSCVIGVESRTLPCIPIPNILRAASDILGIVSDLTIFAESEINGWDIMGFSEAQADSGKEHGIIRTDNTVTMTAMGLIVLFKNKFFAAYEKQSFSDWNSLFDNYQWMQERIGESCNRSIIFLKLP